MRHSTRSTEIPVEIQQHHTRRRRGPTTRSGARVIRAGFTKAVQHILEQDQTGFKQLLIQEMAELKLEDPTDPAEVQDPSGSIQFSSTDHSQVGLIISTFSLDPSVPIDPGLEALPSDPIKSVPTTLRKKGRTHDGLGWRPEQESYRSPEENDEAADLGFVEAEGRVSREKQFLSLS
ncbi:hypothetical protein F2Q68_00042941 [Brassica cretica]|uniref:Uncharacterized protein n=1 Tax=Brassica cretica TaxID=69181 RepID=A0A8S9LP65_BRACR|nr:hypothetical protein F2Q68_00042941 [Brassica cretica]